MVGSIISNSRYTYIHGSKWPNEAVDVHQIIVKRTSAKGFLVYFIALIILVNALYLFLVKGGSVITLLWSSLLDAFLVKLLWRSVIKESVVVFPAFGVQLETHYKSGRVTRRFVPIDKILKPVLLECVTPVTCYWSLSFIAHGEADLVLAFKELRPPMKMLVPIWKALCAATDSKESLEMCKEDG